MTVPSEPARLRVVTARGAFSLCLDYRRSPVTCRYFAELAVAGRLDGSSVFRIVTPDNEPDEAGAISVVQLGLRGERRADRIPMPHESTQLTGLRHRRWTVSAARFRVGELYGSFFICMRDEPCLDHGGARNPDHEGFAAFGRVDSGYETLADLHRQAGPSAILENPIPVHRVELKPAADGPEGRSSGV